jgi:hypothetical protein
VWTPAAPAVTEPLQEQALHSTEPEDSRLSGSAHASTAAIAAAAVSGTGRREYDTSAYSEHSYGEQRSARGSSFGNRSEAAHDDTAGNNGLVQLLTLRMLQSQIIICIL